MTLKEKMNMKKKATSKTETLLFVLGISYKRRTRNTPITSNRRWERQTKSECSHRLQRRGLLASTIAAFP
ncbi:hypothetical protein [Cohnella silvisoli]|uniref:Uncharacterized protein n=1 Tax=Cohnella silvisoli TaxID=2873699 RepID=A0ABV1L1T2_9BACL|nr:hypothetical protein [Cohnella silvisoli]MCD9026478.1 hypothetical protein [Cohnella silvisoli]